MNLYMKNNFKKLKYKIYFNKKYNNFMKKSQKEKFYKKKVKY